MGIFDFLKKRKPALTEAHERKLARVTNPQQRQALLTAIAQGEEIPDYAWHPIPEDFDPVSPSMQRALETLHQRAEEEGRDVFEIIGEMLPGYQSTVQHIADGEISSDTLVPFISEESQRHIVAQAVLDYIMYRRVPADGSLAGVEDVLGMLRTGTTANNGAVLGGLLLTGDRRVADLLVDVVDNVTSGTTIDEMVKTQSGFLYAPVIEFYLAWLEKLNNKAMESQFGSLASGLVLMIQQDRTGVVLEVQRDFGQSSGGDPVHILAQYSFDDYATRVIPRMEAMAEMETGTKVMPYVIAEWRQHHIN